MKMEALHSNLTIWYKNIVMVFTAHCISCFTFKLTPHYTTLYEAPQLDCRVG